MEILVKRFKALSDPNRIRILKMLEVRHMCVCEITSVLGLATSTVSKHLSILRDAGFIVDKKNGKWVEYEYRPINDNITNQIRIVLQDVTLDQKTLNQIQLADRNSLCAK